MNGGAASGKQHDAVARAFAEATTTGQLSTLIALLDPNVVLRSDGGGKVSAALRPIVGADRVARVLRGLPHLKPTAITEPTLTPEGTLDDKEVRGATRWNHVCWIAAAACSAVFMTAVIA